MENLAVALHPLRPSPAVASGVPFYNAKYRHQRKESDRFKNFDYEEIKRDKLNVGHVLAEKRTTLKAVATDPHPIR